MANILSQEEMDSLIDKPKNLQEITRKGGKRKTPTKRTNFFTSLEPQTPKYKYPSTIINYTPKAIEYVYPTFNVDPSKIVPTQSKKTRILPAQ